WSDPTESWAAHPFGLADAFPTEALQWMDSDQDGFGDLPLGAFRDDCPNQAGSSERDLQGCPDQNGDGWSDEYGEFAAAIAIMGEDPAASWLTYAVMGAGFLLGALGALVVKGSRRRKDLLEQLIQDKETELMNSPGMGEPVPALIPLDQLPPLPEPQGGEHDG
ncbi:MAG: hypothetical protein ACPICH_03115, partial [Poseidonia sp.]